MYIWQTYCVKITLINAWSTNELQTNSAIIVHRSCLICILCAVNLGQIWFYILVHSTACSLCVFFFFLHDVIVGHSWYMKTPTFLNFSVYRYIHEPITKLYLWNVHKFYFVVVWHYRLYTTTDLYSQKSHAWFPRVSGLVT